MRKLAASVKPNYRLPIVLHGTLRVAGGRKIPIMVTEVSADRCKVQVDDMLPVGENVQLNVGGRESVDACVQWSVIGKSGLLFVPS